MNTTSSGNRWLGLPTLCCLMLATVSFGAARIHAGAITHAGEITPAQSAAGAPSILTRFVDFKPHAYAPAAFADWVEPAEN